MAWENSIHLMATSDEKIPSNKRVKTCLICKVHLVFAWMRARMHSSVCVFVCVKRRDCNCTFSVGRQPEDSQGPRLKYVRVCMPICAPQLFWFFRFLKKLWILLICFYATTCECVCVCASVCVCGWNHACCLPGVKQEECVSLLCHLFYFCSWRLEHVSTLKLASLNIL